MATLWCTFLFLMMMEFGNTCDRLCWRPICGLGDQPHRHQRHALWPITVLYQYGGGPWTSGRAAGRGGADPGPGVAHCFGQRYFYESEGTLYVPFGTSERAARAPFQTLASPSYTIDRRNGVTYTSRTFLRRAPSSRTQWNFHGMRFIHGVRHLHSGPSIALPTTSGQ